MENESFCTISIATLSAEEPVILAKTLLASCPQRTR